MSAKNQNETVFNLDGNVKFEENDTKRKVCLSRLQGCFELFKRPGTEGEKQSAKGKIESILPKCTHCRKVGFRNNSELPCKLCKGVVKNICDFVYDIRQEELKKQKEQDKTKGKRKLSEKGIDNWSNYVDLFKISASKETILQRMHVDGMSLKSAQGLYSQISCVFGAIRNPHKKDSCVYQAVRYFFYQGPKYSADCCKSSIAVIERVHRNY